MTSTNKKTAQPKTVSQKIAKFLSARKKPIDNRTIASKINVPLSSVRRIIQNMVKGGQVVCWQDAIKTNGTNIRSNGYTINNI